ncbi:MAG: histidine kinase [Flavobacteriales bacterium]
MSDEFIAFNIIVPFWKTSWFYGIIGALLFIVLMLYFRWQVSLMRAQVNLLNDKVELEKSLSQSVLTSIKSQMNPHFFYNALNTIQAYIFTNDKQKATMYLSKFSKLTRLILEMSEKESIRLKEEIEALTLYLELESSRFQEGFTYRFEVDATLDTNLVHVPSMLIQPYVENAIKHGLHHLNGDKELEIRIYSKENLLEVTIDDNGIGRKRSDELNRINKEKHASFSTQANQKRLDVLNRNTTNKISVTYIDKVDDFGNALGTKVILYIPKS